MIKHTLLSFVRQECADFINSECLEIDPFGRPFKRLQQGSCSILQNESCYYFNRCVLPIAIQDGDIDVISQYEEIMDKDFKVIQFNQRKCECGESLKKGKKFCEKCRKKRRQITKRMYQQKYRGS